MRPRTPPSALKLYTNLRDLVLRMKNPATRAGMCRVDDDTFVIVSDRNARSKYSTAKQGGLVPAVQNAQAACSEVTERFDRSRSAAEGFKLFDVLKISSCLSPCSASLEYHGRFRIPDRIQFYPERRIDDVDFGAVEIAKTGSVSKRTRLGASAE